MAAGMVPAPAVGLVMPLATQQGGAENLFRNLLHAKSRSFRYSCLFLQDGPLVSEARYLGYDTTVLRTTHLRDLRNYARTIKAVREWILRYRLDLVFSWMLKAHLYSGPAAMSVQTRRMWFQHGVSRRHWMDVLGACLPTDGILCCSEFVKCTQDMRQPAHRTFACHPGVAMQTGELISRTKARGQLGLLVSERIVCMVARLERWKGAHVFLEMARILGAQHQNAIFVLAGGSHPLDQQYAKEIYQLGVNSKLGARLRLLGQRPAEEIPLWHASADVIVHPVTDAEPFGMAIVEALAMGRAVIASKIGGISEIIEDGVSGIFVQPGDVTALADAVSSLLTDADRRERMEAAALIRAQRFSIEAFTLRFESLLWAGLST